MRGNHQARMRSIGVAFIVGIIVVTVVVFSGIFRKPFEPSTRKVVVDFEHAAQLHPGDQVRINGDIDGKVTSVEPSPHRDAARVTLAVDKRRGGPVYADARARLREKTLLGGAFYVDLERGTPGAGALGNRVITVDRTSVQTEIEDITDVFRADAVAGLQTLPGQVATSLSDPSKPTTALKTANSISRDAATALDAARGEQPGQDLPRLVHSTASAVAALDTPTDDIRTVLSGAAATLQTTGQRAAEIRQAIQAGPGVTYDLTHTLDRLDGTLAVARDLIHRLDTGVPQIAPTLAALHPTLPLATRTLQNAKGLIRALGPTAAQGGRIGAELTPVLDTGTPSLKRLDATILPYLGRKDPITGYSTTVMTGGFAAGFAAVGAQQNQNGHFVRFAASLGASSVYLPCASNLIDPSAASQLACDTLNTAAKNYLSYFPPGLLGGGTTSGGKK